MNAIGGKQHKPQNQSGLGGFASSLLGGQGSHGGSGQGGGGGSGGLAGQLVGGLLGGGKPHNQQSTSQASGGHGQGGLMGMASGFLGGHHSSSVSLVRLLKRLTDRFLGLKQQLRLLFYRPRDQQQRLLGRSSPCGLPTVWATFFESIRFSGRAQSLNHTS